MAAITFAPMAAQTCAAPSNDATINLGSALTGRSTFRTHLSTGTTMGYEITDGTLWEEGYGVLTHGTPDTLARSTVTRNSAGTTDRIVFPGAATVISFPPSTKTIVLDTANAAAFPGTVSASNGTTGTNVVNFSQFAQSKAADGYITLPGGIKLQWGSESVTLSGNAATISFPSSFSGFYTLVVCNGAAPSSQDFVNVTGQNADEFVINVPDKASGAFVVNYFAIGAA